MGITKTSVLMCWFVVFFSFVPFPHRIVNALELQDYLKKSARKLSAGITRKVHFLFLC